MAYLPRIVERELDHLLADLPALAIEGAKGVGKTATAERRAATTRLLDDQTQQTIAAAAPERLLQGEHPILLDEWQLVPEVWDLVRRAVDRDPSPGRFLLTGSASPTRPTHSGAGRIVTLRMRPLSLAEREVDMPTVSMRDLLQGDEPPPQIEGATKANVETYVREIVQSGFPGLRHLHGRPLRAQLAGYVERIVDHDFPEMGLAVRRPATLRQWMTAYAAATATTATQETLRDAATPGIADKPARSTVQPLSDALERLLIIDSVEAWQPTRNHLRRLAAPRKHHLVDPALAAQLLDVDAESLLDSPSRPAPLSGEGTLLGGLFESLVTQSVRVYAQAAEARVRHLRTHGGEHEVDLIVVRRDGKVLAIEVKLTRTVRDDDVRDLLWLRRTIGDQLLDAMVITTGPEAYRRKDGIAVVPAALLGP